MAKLELHDAATQIKWESAINAHITEVFRCKTDMCDYMVISYDEKFCYLRLFDGKVFPTEHSMFKEVMLSKKAHLYTAY